MTASLTATGFQRDRLPEIKVDYDQRFFDVFGPINTSPDAVAGQLQGIWSEGLDNQNEALQDTYDAMYPFSAEGTSLDGAVAFVGLSRIASSETVVTAAAYGTEGTLVPTGSLAHADIQYFSTSDVIISRANALDVEIDVATVSNSAAYVVLAGGTTFTFNSDASATKEEILAGLAALMNADPLTAVVSSGKLRVTAFDKQSPFSLTVDSKLLITKLGSPVVFVATEKGARVLPVGALSNIDTPTLGWDSVFNLAAGATGRDVETDTELRLRHASSVRATGAATVEAIKARMLADVAGVTSIKIYENRTAYVTSDGIPAHSFEAVVQGGANQAVADQLWLTKPAGIETYGNTTIAVLDSAGDIQTIRFSRPVIVYGWINVVVDQLDTEEILPISAIAGIKAAVVAYANAEIGVGDDVIVQRFYGPIYASVDGIGKMTISAAVTSTIGGTPSYSTSNIVIPRAQLVQFDVSRVTVSGI